MLESVSTVQAIYDKSAPDWVRQEPTILSDFTARPPTLDFCGNLSEKRVLILIVNSSLQAQYLVFQS